MHYTPPGDTTSIADRERFWHEVASRVLTWFKPCHTVTEGGFQDGKISWFLGGELNASYNCLDRHLDAHGNKIALICEGNQEGDLRQFTYLELYQKVCRFSNLLKSRGIKKGDRVAIYLPMIAEGVVAMLACARIGAIHSVVFGGFSAESLRARILDADCSAVITVNHAYRGTSLLHFKTNVDEALKGIDSVHSVLLVRHTDHECLWVEGRDVDVNQQEILMSNICAPEIMGSEDPLFILYTSGSTGKPKGLLHTIGGYLTYAAYTHQLVFDLQDQDVYFCTADIGWITGHTYIVYGPLANASTVVIYEGVPTYPTPSRYWDIVDRHRVSLFYTSPTALRSLMQFGDEALNRTSRASLRILGTVGEPINPEAWQWYAQKVGGGRCPIMDTWWQTETGGVMLAPMVEKNQQKPGSTMKPLLGILPEIDRGAFLIKYPWPGIARTIYGDHARFVQTYFKPNPGFYTTGDEARQDEDGDYWILGRMDDVLNVAGHRLGTAEIESALALHPDVVEAAVVGCPHPIKGQGIYAFVTLMLAVLPSISLKEALVKQVRKEIGPIATIDHVQFVAAVPKTRSGKIMRRILRKMVEGERQQFGDLSTLANPESVQEILQFIQTAL
ncbi:MAG: acetate--CoA ligase [Gammaproteobacteria bacterium]|nr:acetate--CoA ligase [Gammaproteobacteria bacterium]